MRNTLSVFDGVNGVKGSSQWTSVSEICRMINERPNVVKYKLLDLCKRGVVERKVDNGKPMDLFRYSPCTDNPKVEYAPIENLKKEPRTWNFGYDDLPTKSFLSAKPGSKFNIRGEK